MAAQKKQRPLIRYAGSAAETSIGSKPIGSELSLRFYPKWYFCQASLASVQSRATLPEFRSRAIIIWTIMGVLAGCDARYRSHRRAIPCKRPATQQCARQHGQNVQLVVARLPSQKAAPRSGEIAVSLCSEWVCNLTHAWPMSQSRSPRTQSKGIVGTLSDNLRPIGNSRAMGSGRYARASHINQSFISINTSSTWLIAVKQNPLHSRIYA